MAIKTYKTYFTSKLFVTNLLFYTSKLSPLFYLTDIKSVKMVQEVIIVPWG